jgi:hypothetical protein
MDVVPEREAGVEIEESQAQSDHERSKAQQREKILDAA